MSDPRTALTLEEVDQRIFDLYQFFHQADPTVKPNPEAGELGLLWRIHDDFMNEEA